MTSRIRIYNFGPGDVQAKETGYPPFEMKPGEIYDAHVHGDHCVFAKETRDPAAAPPQTNEHVVAGCESFPTPSNFQIGERVVMRGIVEGVHFEAGKVSYVVSMNPFGDEDHTFQLESDCVSAA